MNCHPARAGEINTRTDFALKRFGVEPPELLTDVWMRVGNWHSTSGRYHPTSRCWTPPRRLPATRGPIPVVGDGKPIGIMAE